MVYYTGEKKHLSRSHTAAQQLSLEYSLVVLYQQGHDASFTGVNKLREKKPNQQR